ncbi:MAG: TetR/AcrR family transcriptional regulator [Solirubrobacteraceae bacterium]
MLRLVAEQGVGAVSHRQVAAAAGVSLGTLTYHFKGRDDLLRESLRLFSAEETRRLESIAVELRAGERGLEDVERLIAAAVDGMAETQQVVAQFELYLHATRDPGLERAVREGRDAFDDLARELLERLGVPDAAGLAPIVVATAEGMALRRLGTGEDTGPILARALLLLAAGAHAAA